MPELPNACLETTGRLRREEPRPPANWPACLESATQNRLPSDNEAQTGGRTKQQEGRIEDPVDGGDWALANVIGNKPKGLSEIDANQIGEPR